jgi:hypothetical protein
MISNVGAPNRDSGTPDACVATASVAGALLALFELESIVLRDGATTDPLPSVAREAMMVLIVGHSVVPRA